MEEEEWGRESVKEGKDGGEKESGGKCEEGKGREGKGEGGKEWGRDCAALKIPLKSPGPGPGPSLTLRQMIDGPAGL